MMKTDDAVADGTAPLDMGPLPSLLGYALRRAQMMVFADFHRTCEQLGVRPAQYSVMQLLRHNPGVRASRLADALGIQRTNFTTLLAAMEGAGLVERRTDPRDRRASALMLSEKGIALLGEVEATLEPHEWRWRRQLGAAGYERLLALLGQVAEADHGEKEAGGAMQTSPGPGGSA